MIILVTGAAGFIGYHLCEKLLALGHTVIGLDNLNNYYDVQLKYDRLMQLGIQKKDAAVELNLCVSSKHGIQMQFIKMALEDRIALPELFIKSNFDMVCNLAAQAGVRYSIENPESYIDSNIAGFLNVLEACRHYKVRRLVYASSSSVYGNSDQVPFKETANVDLPISLYAATKKSNELMAYTYSHLYGIETIGLRFFTVYGPWGRPDMAMFLFTEAILNNRTIKVFNNGLLSRDFTYIDDIIEGVLATLLIDREAKTLNEVFNIGNGQPVQLLDFIHAIEKQLEKIPEKRMLPMQSGDVKQTWADMDKFKTQYKYAPNTSINTGVASFINWYKKYYKP